MRNSLSAPISANLGYYPFGMMMPNRTYTAGSSYRFGFNKGSEKDNEIYGDGNSYTTEFRELDSRLSRWLSCDPIPNPFESEYLSMRDNPIGYTDFLGNHIEGDYFDEKGDKIGTDGQDDKKKYLVLNKSDIKRINKNTESNKNTDLNSLSACPLELPDETLTGALQKALDNSNSPTTDDVQGGNHEEGGYWGISDAGKEVTIEAKSGKYAALGIDENALINPMEAKDESQQVPSQILGTFHVHPSGYINYKNDPSNTQTGGTISNGGSPTNLSFVQEPSDIDISNQLRRENEKVISGLYSIVVAAYDKKIYFYNGNGIIGSVPFNVLGIKTK